MVHHSKSETDVRFGSLAAAMALIFGVRFTPESCRANQPLGRQLRADFVAKRFSASERRTFFPNQGSIENFDSKIRPFGF
jgi:hypothetical protein